MRLRMGARMPDGHAVTRAETVDTYLALWTLGAVAFVMIGAKWSRGPRINRDRRHGPRRSR